MKTDQLRGTGRSTVLILRAIADAIANGESEFVDHQTSGNALSSSKNAYVVDHVIRRLGLFVDVSEVGGRVILKSTWPKRA